MDEVQFRIKVVLLLLVLPLYGIFHPLSVNNLFDCLVGIKLTGWVENKVDLLLLTKKSLVWNKVLEQFLERIGCPGWLLAQWASFLSSSAATGLSSTVVSGVEASRVGAGCLF